MFGLVERWKVHRFLVDRAGLFWPFSGRAGRKRVVFLSEWGEIADAQVYPFFLFARELARQQGIEVRELPLKQFLNGKNPYAGKADAVCFQTWFDLTHAQLDDVVDRIKAAWPGVALAYLDWFAPTDLRFAGPLYPHVAAYVKKQVFKDFSVYGRPTIGDTNLTEYYAKRFHLELPQVTFPVPAGFEQKLILGSGFEHSPLIASNLLSPPNFGGRSIDLHARLTTLHKKKAAVEWYTYMRQESLDKVADLDGGLHIASKGRVSRKKFYDELRNSKMCFSPFGYGEVCWRDFEAMCTGALLLKPDMSHLRLANDPFKPGETYVPLAWDLSDLRDKVEYYRNHASERETIARNAFEMLSQHLRQKRFVQDAVPLWRMLKLV